MKKKPTQKELVYYVERRIAEITKECELMTSWNNGAECALKGAIAALQLRK